MTEQLLICTDLDRTLIPNGQQSESPHVRRRFAALAGRTEVHLAYVSGRHLSLVEQAISNYALPRPDFVIADVGANIYYRSEHGWRNEQGWQTHISEDWGGCEPAQLRNTLAPLKDLRPQEASKQGQYKLSFYVPMHCDRNVLSEDISRRLRGMGIEFNLIWSTDEPNQIGLLDVMPARVSKLHAIEWLLGLSGISMPNTVFCGDSGNDMEVLVSAVPAVLVANAVTAVRAEALARARQAGLEQALYAAKGGFFDSNGNYAGGMLEGIAHYHPDTQDWMRLPEEVSAT